MHRWSGLVVGVAALALLATTAGAGASASPLAGQSAVDPDTTVMTVALQPDGDARWTVEYRLRLATENDTAAFEDLQADVDRNRSAYVERFRERMARTARTAENATGRSMAIEAVSVSTSRESLPESTGVVTYQFTWTGFAATDGDRIEAGDAIAGLYLDEGTTLRISWPDGYEARTVAPEPATRSDGEVQWDGSRAFGDGEPTVVVGPADAGPGLATIGAALVAVLVLALVGGWLYRQRAAAGPEASGTEGAVEADDGGSGGGGARAASGGGAAEGDADESAGPPSELLSNEERVLALLEDNGGRMKQQTLASELDWTGAKTSQVVGDLREAEQVETFRLGRENVVTLPGVGIEGDAGDTDGE